MHEGGIKREQLYETYIPYTATVQKGRTKNIEDAIHYLKSVGLIEGERVYTSIYSANNSERYLPFGLILLRQFRQLEHIATQLSLLDFLYITLLERLYIAPNRVWISDLHTAANELDMAQQLGGVSQEKITAWKRVMEFLGIGHRMGSGFYCLFRPSLLKALVQQWSEEEGTLQAFFEDYAQTWFPCLTARGDVALSVAATLEQLMRDEYIRLTPKQDSPVRPYFGNHRFRGIEIVSR
jgi:hypothetical protein